MKPNKTYKEAKAGIWHILEETGWHMSNPFLKVPHATDPDTGLRVWFKPQAIYFGWTTKLNDARSLSGELDIRDFSAHEVVGWITKEATS